MEKKHDVSLLRLFVVAPDARLAGEEMPPVRELSFPATYAPAVGEIHGGEDAMIQTMFLRYGSLKVGLGMLALAVVVSVVVVAVVTGVS